MKNSTPAFLQRRQHRKARHTAKRQAQRCAQRRAAAAEPSRGQAVLYELCKTIHHFFPDLFDRRRQVEDCRQKLDYTLVEILLAGIMLFVFQQGSRNALNNKRDEKKFRRHYERWFKLRLPHLDTVHRVLCRLPDAELEPLKHTLVKTLLEKKVLPKYRLFGRWFVVAVDGTRVVSFSEPHCEHCLHRTSKTGNTTYFHPVLEAKLITASGLAISLAAEWITNPDHSATVIDQTWRWFNHLDYRGHTLAWLECVEVVTSPKQDPPRHHRFVRLTNLTVTARTVRALSHTGRLRWKIENEGFNTQKPLGYGLEHKYARVSWQAAKNYYQCGA